MFTKYKILAGMLKLWDFTIPELVQVSGARPATVRTEVNRSDFLEVIETIPTGRPGGQIKRFRIRPGEVEGLRTKLDEAYRSLGDREKATVQIEYQQPDLGPMALAALASAEELLLYALPGASGAGERGHILEMIGLELTSAEEDIRVLPSNLKADSGRRLALAQRLLAFSQNAPPRLPDLPAPAGQVLDGGKTREF